MNLNLRTFIRPLTLIYDSPAFLVAFGKEEVNICKIFGVYMNLAEEAGFVYKEGQGVVSAPGYSYPIPRQSLHPHAIFSLTKARKEMGKTRFLTELFCVL